MKFIRTLFRKPVTERVQPDTFPPDGSAHFITCLPVDGDDLSPNFKIYEFGANCYEEEAEFIPQMIEIMRHLCRGMIVLTDIESASEKIKSREYSRSERFTVRFRRFLEKTRPELSVFSESEKRLAILTDGFCADNLFVYEELETLDYCWFNFYLFSEKDAPVTAQQAWDMVRGKKFSVRFSINDSPVALEMVIDPTTVDVASVRTVVEEVCKDNGVLLVDPAENTPD